MPELSTAPADSAIAGTEKMLTLAFESVTVQQVADANESKSSSIASAATTDLSAATSAFVHVTGTTTITALGTAQAGTRRIVVIDDILTFTHNATSLILPTGANITTAAGDVATFVSEGSGNWRCVDYTKADGTALAGSGGGSDVLDVSSPSNSSGTVTLDFDSKSRYAGAITLGANVTTLAFSNLPGSGKFAEYELHITQDGTGSRTFAIPASHKALGGSDTAIASAANAVTVLTASTVDNGTTWRYAMQESA